MTFTAIFSFLGSSQMPYLQGFAGTSRVCIVQYFECFRISPVMTTSIRLHIYFSWRIKYAIVIIIA